MVHPLSYNMKINYKVVSLSVFLLICCGLMIGGFFMPLISAGGETYNIIDYYKDYAEGWKALADCSSFTEYGLTFSLLIFNFFPAIEAIVILVYIAYSIRNICESYKSEVSSVTGMFKGLTFMSLYNLMVWDGFMMLKGGGIISKVSVSIG